MLPGEPFPRPAIPLSPPPMPAAGWYPDPQRQRAMRYFDGTNWTTHVAGEGGASGALSTQADPHPSLSIWFAVVGLAVVVGALIVQRSVLEGLVRAGAPIGVMIPTSAIVGYGPMVLFLWWASKQWGSNKPRTDYGITAKPVDLGWGVVGYVAIILAMGVAVVLVEAFNVPLTSNTEGFNSLRESRTLLIAMGITAMVLAPIIEEIAFRGAIMRGLLSEMGPRLAIPLQGLAFGLVHIGPERGSGNIGLVIILTVAGCGLGVLAYLTRRLAPSMVAHFVMNCIAFFVSVYR